MAAFVDILDHIMYLVLFSTMLHVISIIHLGPLPLVLAVRFILRYWF